MRVTERDYRATIAVMHDVAEVADPADFARVSLAAGLLLVLVRRRRRARRA